MPPGLNRRFRPLKLTPKLGETGVGWNLADFQAVLWRRDFQMRGIDASEYHCIMRTTLTLDDDVFEAAQALARASGHRLGHVVSELLRRSLQAPPAAASRNGLPVFTVRDGAAIIPSDRARDLLADEL